MARSKTRKVSGFDNLGRSLASLHGETVSVNQRAKNHRSKKASHEMWVPRPKGSPGRHSGYSIKDAMGLASQTGRYNLICDRIRTLVIRYLDTSRLLSQQKDRLLVEKVIRKAQSDMPFLKKFKGGWAVRDIMDQFLRNRSAREREMNKVLKRNESDEDSKAESEEESDEMSTDGLESQNWSDGERINDEASDEDTNFIPGFTRNVTKKKTKKRKIHTPGPADDSDDNDNANANEELPHMIILIGLTGRYKR